MTLLGWFVFIFSFGIVLTPGRYFSHHLGWVLLVLGYVVVETTFWPDPDQATAILTVCPMLIIVSAWLVVVAAKALFLWGHRQGLKDQGLDAPSRLPAVPRFMSVGLFLGWAALVVYGLFLAFTQEARVWQFCF